MSTTAVAKTIDFVRSLEGLGIDDVPVVGGKNASLGEMIQELKCEGIAVPGGFATTAQAYQYYLETTGLDKKVRKLLTGLKVDEVEDLQRRGMLVRHAILATPIPLLLTTEIWNAYDRLCQEAGGELASVAVRSSATAEDLPDASFAGQQETFLNIVGKGALLEACHKCFASLFTDRAIAYREHQGFDHFQVALSIGVQHMVRSDVGSAGVMFTIDTETGFEDAVLIDASYGLGENVVKGVVNPDHYVVFKPTLASGFRPILQRELGTKEFKLICNSGGSKPTRNVPVLQKDRDSFVLDDEEILQLGRWAAQIESHYSKKYGRPTPMDIEWAKDGQTNELYIVQARPETVQSQKSSRQLQQYQLRQTGQPLVTGNAIGQKIGNGLIRVIHDLDDLGGFQEGEILVSEKTDPDWEPIMKKASAVVTDHGGRTCHAAIVARELGVPAIVGCNNATQILKTGDQVTVCCAEGEVGTVYQGILEYDVKTIDLDSIPETRTQLMVNVANPNIAFSLASFPLDGVGLARMEFTISNFVKVHPLALLDYETLDEPLRKQIDAITVGYDDKIQFFVDRLAQGIGMIAAAFYPREVIVRMSDFKTNEYANLIGGESYEPDEENPMIGFRGASRYYDDRYKAGFELECRAMKKVRDEMGLKNLKLMVPFCRTVDEGRKVIDEMARYGLVRGDSGLELYVMCEIPSNVILAEQFAEIFDGFSIGSNDLTQLTLGIDRDSEIISHIFDERNDAVKAMITQAIEKAKAARSKIGFCGQAPSDFPEFAKFLVECGIDSISVTPDVALKTKLIIAEAE